MGRPIAAAVIRDDGSEQLFENPEDALARTDEGRVEYRYDYRPDLLPSSEEPVTSMWRYEPLLPIEPGPIHYPLAIGGTPLVAPPNMRHDLGLPHLFLKDETRTPTGSNKDRATALVLEQAIRDGRPTVSCASTGNVAASLAVGAAAAGKQAVIFVPAEVASGKLMLMLLSGATVLRVSEGYDAAFKLSRRAAQEFGWYDRNTGYNPLTLDAKKTVAFEIWEQLGREVPDVIISPVGDGVTLSAIAKGFRELVACGTAERMPRIIGVQAEGCQPLKAAWETGQAVMPVEPQTIADGIAVCDPVSAGMVLRDIRETRGGFVSVTDDDMLRAIATLAAGAGLLAEPAGAAATAGLLSALDQGLVARDERIVALVTGTLLKNAGHLRLQVDAPEIHADLEELRGILGESLRHG